MSLYLGFSEKILGFRVGNLLLEFGVGNISRESEFRVEISVCGSQQHWRWLWLCVLTLCTWS
jgi:hypothetical protein